MTQQYDILEVAREKTKLRESGEQYVGRCPLPGHEKDRTPSFFVHPHKGPGVFYCWGCQRGGDVYTLLSILTGRPRSSFLPKVKKADLGALRNKLKALANPPIAWNVKELMHTARSEWAYSFKMADTTLRGWKAGYAPTSRRYKGSVQQYIDEMGEDYWRLLGNLERRIRARKVMGDPVRVVATVLDRMRAEIKAVIGVPIPAQVPHSKAWRDQQE